jgi:hypothetical protein
MEAHGYDDEWEGGEYRRRDIHMYRNIQSLRTSGPAQDRYSAHQGSSYRRRAPRRSPPERSQSLPRSYASIPSRDNPSAQRRYPFSRKQKISISTTFSESNESLDSLSSIEVSEEEDEVSSEESQDESEEESEKETRSDEKEESSDEVEEIQQHWDRLSIKARSDGSHLPGRSSNWLEVHHPKHSVSAPTSPRYWSSTHSPVSLSPLTASQSRQGSPPRGPPKPPRLFIGPDGDRDGDDSSSNGMPYLSNLVPSNITLLT